MTFFELDEQIRLALPDSPERRNILQSVNDLHEGLNVHFGLLLKILGYESPEPGADIWSKDKTFIRQLQEKL